MQPIVIPDLVTDASVARLATIGADGPHLVPIVYAVAGATLFTAVDHKPKSTRSLRRLVNIEHDPRVSVLVDHYDEDWTLLWWVRLDGHATVLVDGFDAAVDALVAKYPQYSVRRPAGPVISVEVERVRKWSAG